MQKRKHHPLEIG